MDGAARVTVYLEMRNRLKTGLDNAKKYLNETVQGFKDKLKSLKESHVQAISAMKQEFAGLGRAIELATNPYILMAAGIVALGAAFSKASAMASDFDKQLAKANTTAQEKPEQLKKTKAELGKYAAGSTVENAHQNVTQAYDVMLSSGLDRDTSLKSVPTLLKASKATGTDTETVAKATAGVMNSSGIKDSNIILDKMAMIKNKGNAEFKDIANYLPKIIPAANNAGVALDDVGGAFAYLTAMGLKSEQAATGLENAFKTLADPNKAENFKKIGVNFYDNAGKMKPMLDIVGQLQNALTGLTDQQKSTVLNSLGLDMESASAFAVLTKDTDKLKDSIDGVANAKGELDNQFKAAETPMDSWVQISNMINEGWRKLGDIVNSVIGPLGSWIIENKDNLMIFGGVILGAAAAWGAYILVTNAAAIATGAWATITGVAAAAQGAWNAAWAASGIGTIVMLIGALVGALVVAYNRSEKFRAVLAGLMAVASLVGDVFIGLGKTIAGAFTLDIGLIKEGMTQSATAVTEIINGGVKKKFTEAYNQSIAESTANAAADAKKEANTPEKQDNLMKPNAQVQAVLDAENKKRKDKQEKENGMNGQSTTKTININKLSVVDGNFISSSTEVAGMGKADLERWFEAMLTRALVNLGRSYN